MSRLQFKPLIEAIHDYDAFLFDLWGVIVEGVKIYDGVIDTINQISKQKKVFFVSNAPRPRFNVLERLNSWGLAADANNIFTSGEITREILLTSKDSLNIVNPIIYHLGADRNFDIISDLKLNTTSDIDKANILLLTLYRDEGENLSEFDDLFEQISLKNMICICANPDTIIPNLGLKRYCPGFFAEKYEQQGGKVIYTGKPHLIIYDKLLNMLSNIPKNRILMIGDTIETDILGAKNAGIHSALVMTGNAEKFHIGFDNFEQKLTKLYEESAKQNALPTFVTKLSS